MKVESKKEEAHNAFIPSQKRKLKDKNSLQKEKFPPHSTKVSVSWMLTLTLGVSWKVYGSVVGLHEL